MIFFLTSDLMKAVRGQKHLSEAKKGMKELIYWKKCFMKVVQQPQKHHDGSNQIWATTSDKKRLIPATSIKPKPQSAHEAPKKPAKRDS